MKPLLSFLNRRIRLNAEPAGEHHRLFAPGIKIALNADTTLPEWIQLAPYGSHPTSERDANGEPEAMQVFDAASAARVVKWFNFFPRKLARLARVNSIKVYVGHPDFAPEIWPERIELGSVEELKADDDGLNGRIRWNADALQQVRIHKFPSVAWDTEPIGDGSTEKPVLLWSVGMCRRPNIKNVNAVINAQPDAEEDPEPEPKEAPAMTLLDKIKGLLKEAGIIKESDSEESLLNGLSSMISNIAWKREEEERQKALSGELKAALNAETDVPLQDGVGQVIARLNAATTASADLQQRLDALTAERDSERKARINAMLEHLVETGRISKAEADDAGEAAVAARLNAHPDEVMKELMAKPRLNAKGISLADRVAVGDAFERSTRLNAWIENHMAEKKCDRAAAWEASKADPAMKAIHAAMDEADKARAEHG